MEAIKITLITLAIIATLFIGVVGMYATLIIGIPVGIWYMVRTVRMEVKGNEFS